MWRLINGLWNLASFFPVWVGGGMGGWGKGNPTANGRVSSTTWGLQLCNSSVNIHFTCVFLVIFCFTSPVSFNMWHQSVLVSVISSYNTHKKNEVMKTFYVLPTNLTPAASQLSRRRIQLHLNFQSSSRKDRRGLWRRGYCLRKERVVDGKGILEGEVKG